MSIEATLEFIDNFTDWGISCLTDNPSEAQTMALHLSGEKDLTCLFEAFFLSRQGNFHFLAHFIPRATESALK